MSYSLETQELLDLFVRFCPVWYYTKKEPYMPATFEDILSISTLIVKADNKQVGKQITLGTDNNIQLDWKTLNRVMASYQPGDIANMLINIDKDKRKQVPVGKQIICRTTGLWSRDIPLADMHWQYLDLQYITMYAWNGTISSHAFDAETVVVRLVKYDNTGPWEIKRVYGSSHGNGMWTDKRFLELEGSHPVIFCAEESHSMYFKPAVYKRMFRFADDVCKREVRWEPTEFLYVPIDTMPVYRAVLNESSHEIQLITGLNTDGGELDYYRFNGLIGNAKNNQVFPLSTRYADTDTNNLDGYYKYEGGINNLFNGRHAKISHAVYITILVVVSIILSVNGILGFMWPDKPKSGVIAVRWVLHVLSVPAFAIAVIAFLFVN